LSLVDTVVLLSVSDSNGTTSAEQKRGKLLLPNNEPLDSEQFYTLIPELKNKTL
jgi:hypothetical protein